MSVGSTPRSSIGAASGSLWSTPSAAGSRVTARSRAYVYTDSFRRKMAVVKLRNGFLPLMTEIGMCRWGDGYSADREGDDFVYRCGGEEKRIPLARVQSKPSE